MVDKFMNGCFNVLRCCIFEIIYIKYIIFLDDIDKFMVFILGIICISDNSFIYLNCNRNWDLFFI